MKSKRSIRIVTGYHEHTPVPAEAVKWGLLSRLAVIFDPPLDPVLFLAILREILEAVPHDGLAIQVDDSTEYHSLDEFSAYLLGIRQEDVDEDLLPPRRVVLSKNGEVTCLEETEFWYFCGGPPPYSDSFTASFYTREDQARSVEAACLSACKQSSVPVSEIIRGSTRPVRVHWWKRILKRVVS